MHTRLTMIIMQIVKLRFNIYFNFCCGRRIALVSRALVVLFLSFSCSLSLSLSLPLISRLPFSSRSLTFSSSFSSFNFHSMRDQQRYQCWMKTVFLLGKCEYVAHVLMKSKRDETCRSYNEHTEKKISKCNNNQWCNTHTHTTMCRRRSRIH